ncbi:Hypothetical protein NTJ_04722 [Nesidiocoris tenuis]|uniref:MD-2-related lipid-recognition domain-containing protein n=1 Tax=Nesidiocoris tenuis TaxID=355587 RepID=A0ABN7AI49_9HEMI|nr:Hypothetical protein NTJ_04722 [Nesidiocoris tenuis]
MELNGGQLLQLIVIFTIYCQLTTAKHIAVWQFFGNCKESESNSLFHFENSHWGMVTPEISELNTTFVLMQDMDIVTSKVSAYKCKSDKESDCEIMMTVPVNDVCSRLREKNQLYSIFTEAMHPPMPCPFKKGSYPVVRARINLNVVQSLMEENTIYLLKFPGDYHGKSTGCMMVKAKKISVKTKRKNRK